MHFGAHVFEIKVFVPYGRIIVEQLIKLSQFEQDHLIKILALYPPKLFHGGCEFAPGLVRHMKGCGIVPWIFWLPHLRIFTVLFPCPDWGRVCELLKLVLRFFLWFRLCGRGIRECRLSNSNFFGWLVSFLHFELFFNIHC